MCRIISLFIVLVVAIITKADDLSQGVLGTNLEIQKGYALNTVIDETGRPSGFLYGKIGAKISQVPPSSQYPYESTNLSLGNTAVWLNRFTTAAYFFSGLVAALSLYYICSISFGNRSLADFHDKETPASKIASEKSETLDEEEIQDNNEDDEDAENDNDNDNDNVNVKSRKRRAVRKADVQATPDLTRLTTLVLSAIQSGECLKKSICVLGSQISESPIPQNSAPTAASATRGNTRIRNQNQNQNQNKNRKEAPRSSASIKARVVDTVLSSILPTSVQQNDYYNILRRSALSEIACETFACQH